MGWQLRFNYFRRCTGAPIGTKWSQEPQNLKVSPERSTCQLPHHNIKSVVARMPTWQRYRKISLPPSIKKQWPRSLHVTSRMRGQMPAHLWWKNQLKDWHTHRERDFRGRYFWRFSRLWAKAGFQSIQILSLFRLPLKFLRTLQIFLLAPLVDFASNSSSSLLCILPFFLSPPLSLSLSFASFCCSCCSFVFPTWLWIFEFCFMLFCVCFFWLRVSCSMLFENGWSGSG